MSTRTTGLAKAANMDAATSRCSYPNSGAMTIGCGVPGLCTMYVLTPGHWGDAFRDRYP